MWFQYILDHPDLPWDYDYISASPNIKRSGMGRYKR